MLFVCGLHSPSPLHLPLFFMLSPSSSSSLLLPFPRVFPLFPATLTYPAISRILSCPNPARCQPSVLSYISSSSFHLLFRVHFPSFGSPTLSLKPYASLPTSPSRPLWPSLHRSPVPTLPTSLPSSLPLPASLPHSDGRNAHNTPPTHQQPREWRLLDPYRLF